MQTTQVSVAVDQSVLSVGDHHSVAYAVIGRERTGTRPPTESDEDCAIHLATSADWWQPVPVQVEVIPVGQPMPTPEANWQLEGEGTVPFRVMPIQVMTGLEDPAGCDLDLDLAPGIYRYRAWVRGREQNRAFLESWLDARTIDDLTAPPAFEQWLLQLTMTDQQDPTPARGAISALGEPVQRTKPNADNSKEWVSPTPVRRLTKMPTVLHPIGRINTRADYERAVRAAAQKAEERSPLTDPAPGDADQAIDGRHEGG